MGIKIFLFVLFLGISAFVAFRFGLFTPGQTDESLNEMQQIPPVLQPQSTPIPESTTSALIKLLEAPTEATTGSLVIKWLIEYPKIATISHTAVHFGPTSRQSPKLPSDYPEKTTILKGTIPATFSAELKVPLPGIYFYRAHTIVDEVNVWSEEKELTVVTPIPTPGQ